MSGLIKGALWFSYMNQSYYNIWFQFGVSIIYVHSSYNTIVRVWSLKWSVDKYIEREEKKSVDGIQKCIYRNKIDSPLCYATQGEITYVT